MPKTTYCNKIGWQTVCYWQRRAKEYPIPYRWISCSAGNSSKITTIIPSEILLTTFAACGRIAVLIVAVLVDILLTFRAQK
jgi:hypothetical protein